MGPQGPVTGTGWPSPGCSGALQWKARRRLWLRTRASWIQTGPRTCSLCSALPAGCRVRSLPRARLAQGGCDWEPLICLHTFHALGSDLNSHVVTYLLQPLYCTKPPSRRLLPPGWSSGLYQPAHSAGQPLTSPSDTWHSEMTNFLIFSKVPKDWDTTSSDNHPYHVLSCARAPLGSLLSLPS